jgi:hypothetical protein
VVEAEGVAGVNEPVDAVEIRKWVMNARNAGDIWKEQCEAAQSIGAKYGLTAAFNYLVGEKLMNFLDVASRHNDFARELPQFVAEVRRLFTADEIRANLAQIEGASDENDVDLFEDDLCDETPSAAEERVRQIMLVKELLTATTLGIS